MNEKCKYCDYISKCSRICEYNSFLCKVNRSFPKIVNKSYEQLQEENQQLQEKIEYFERSNNRREDTILEQRQEISNLEQQCKKQKEFINYLENMLDDENDIFSVVRVKDALQKYREIIGVSDESNKQ